MNSLNPDLSKPTCRICLKNKIAEEMFSIFDMDAELQDLRLYEKIERCADIKIICGAEFPAFICYHCNKFLKISYEFRTMCRNSEEYLKLIVETEVIQPKKENLNILPTVQSTCNENTSSTVKRGDSLSPLHEFLEEDEKVSFSSAHYEDQFHEFLSDNESDVFVDINYPDGEDSFTCSENIENPVENIELEMKEKMEENCPDKKILTTKKTSNATEKMTKNTLVKTLEISADGAAIIKKRKPRSKREDMKQPHVCEICGNVYKRRHILEHHVKRHSNEKDFECEICTSAFHSNFELRRHMRKHTGARPYKCSYCSSAFGDHSTLTKHERVHRNERPFKCDICGSCFSYPGVLKRHKLVHTGEKPYKCEICGKCFNDRYHFQSHLKTIQHKNDPRVESLLQNIRENNV